MKRAYDYLLKPLDLQKLDRVLGEALKVARLMREPAVVVGTPPDDGQAGEAIVGSCPEARSAPALRPGVHRREAGPGRPPPGHHPPDPAHEAPRAGATRHAPRGSQRRRAAEAAPGAAPAPPTNHGLRPPGRGTLASAAPGLFLPIEQSGITSGLPHDRQPERVAPYGRRNSRCFRALRGLVGRIRPLASRLQFHPPVQKSSPRSPGRDAAFEQEDVPSVWRCP